MNTKIKIAISAIVFLTAIFFFEAKVYSQDATPPVMDSAHAPATDKTKSDDNKDAKSVDQAQPAPPPETDLWKRDYLTGDWGGTRTRLKNKGVDMEFALTQFEQGVAGGGISTDNAYTGVFQAEFKFDFGKLAEWKYWSADVKTELRFGGNALLTTGAFNPVNTAGIIPGADGTVFAITAANVTRIFPIDMQKGDMMAVSVGRYNYLDLIDEDFSGGSGITRFMNLAQLGPLTILRQVPLISNGASFVYIKGGEPRFTLALIDPNNHLTNPGISDLFDDGVTFYPSYTIPTKYWGKFGKHNISVAVTTKKFTPFDTIKQIILPGPPVSPLQGRTGSWSVNYEFSQRIVERSRHDGWGLFSQVSIADTKTSPITEFVTVALVGNGLSNKRPKDEFGIGYSYTNASRDLKDLIDVATTGHLVPEHDFEMFYNLHITPWSRLTGDLQVLRGVRGIAQPAVVPAVRLELIF